MVTGPRLATFDELDAVKKELQSLERRVDGIVAGLNTALRHAQQTDQGLQAAMHSADAATRRTERLDVAMLARVQTLDLTAVLAVITAFPRLLQKVEKIEQSVAKLQRDSTRH